MRNLIHSMVQTIGFNPQTMRQARTNRRHLPGAFLLTVLLLGVFGLTSMTTVEGVGGGGAATKSEDFGRLPLYFVENRGQLDPSVAYSIQGRDQTVYFTSQGVTFSLAGKEKANPRRWTLKLDFLDANPAAQIVGEGSSGARFSYFHGRPEAWRADVPAWRGIVYRNLWPGIDLVYTGDRERLKYSFIVSPGADPARIRMAWRGAKGVAVNRAGELEVTTPQGIFRDEAPVSFQELNGSSREVRTAYRVHQSTAAGRTEYGFDLDAYDRTRELVIDPAILLYCGFLGGDGDETGNDIAVDRDGNVYIVGDTSSTQSTFPTAVGPDLTYNDGSRDAFIAKLNAAGTDLVYCGFIGGASSDLAKGVAVDADGNAYVVGETFSRETSFPVLGGPDLTFNGSQDAFIAKVNAAGTALVYCGYIGGGRRDFAGKVAVNSLGNAFVVGYTDSPEETFPVAVGPDLTQNGDVDAFVARVNTAGDALDYCGYIGGDQSDYGRDIAVDTAGNAYITGNTSSDEVTFPITPMGGGLDPTYNGGLSDAFVAKIDPTGAALVYSGYLGGSGSDIAHSLALDATGAVYLAGETNSDEASFPVLGGPDLTHNGMVDAFVARINPAGSALVFSGYIGGTGIDRAFGIALDADGAIYLAGETSSFQTSFPVIGGPDLQSNGVVDAFVAKLNAAGTSLIYCGYLGGAGNDFALSIAVDGDSNAIVTGYTESNQSTFPVTTGPDLTFNGGEIDAFVAKIARRPDVTPPSVAPVGAISRIQGTGGNSTLAFVSDVDTLPGNIFVALKNVPAGVTVTSLTNTDGTIAADIAVSCNTPPGAYVLSVEAIDGAGLLTSSNLTLNVAANSAPQLGSYPNAEVEFLASATVSPTSAPSDNGVIAALTATAPGFTGAFDINPLTGEIAISDAAPAGVFTVTVTATDNCGATTLRTFRLSVGGAATTVNAASFAGGEAAAESIVAIFAAAGSGLATTTAVAEGLPLPTELGGTTVSVVDQAGADRAASLFFVSPGQVNFLIPEGTANGEATVIVRSGDGSISVDRLAIVNVAPGIFTASATGSGVAAAQVLRVAEDGTQTFEQTARFDQETMQWVPIPIDFGAPTDTLFLILYGTGFRFSGGFEVTTVVVGGTGIRVLFAGAAIGFVGLDQINGELPRSLAGKGEVDVTVTIEGKAANTFKLAFR